MASANTTLLYNAKIWTSETIFQWLSFSNGKLVDLGTAENCPNPSTFSQAIDAEGRVVLPGLQDAHIHVYNLGQQSFRVDLRGAQSINEIQQRLKKHMEKPRALIGRWLIGHGWDQDSLAEQRHIQSADIDSLFPDTPVLLLRACCHIACVNSKGLELLGYDAQKEDPSGGRIDRLEDGSPSGIIRETALSPLNDDDLLGITDAEKLTFFQKGIDTCLKFGLTGVQTNDRDAWRFYSKMQSEGNLPIRTFLTIYHDEIGNKFSPPAGAKEKLLNCHRVKLLADGSLGAETAACKHHYIGTHSKGMLIYTSEDLNEKVRFAREKGYRLEVHAIGDRAAEQCLNAFVDEKDRPILTHCQILNRDLIQEMKLKNVIANIQPSFVVTDSEWASKRLPSLEHAYCWKTLLDEGIVCAGGSDAPIETPNPFVGMYDAIFRKTGAGDVWMPEQCVSLHEAIEMYTKGAAYAAGEETCLGRLEKGFMADFVMVDVDVLADPTLLRTARPAQVWVAGERKL